MKILRFIKVFAVVLVVSGCFLIGVAGAVGIYESNGSASMELHSAGSVAEMVGLVVTSPSGKKVGGKSTDNDEWFNDFAEGEAAFGYSYMPCGGGEDDECPGPDPQGVEGVMRLEEYGTYTVVLYGNDFTEASLGIFISDSANGRRVRYIAYAMLDAGLTATFKINYEPGPENPIKVIRITNIGVLKKDIESFYRYWQVYVKRNIGNEYWRSYIDNEGIMKSLLKKAEAVEDTANRGQYKAAVNQLKALINEVKAQTGKHLDERAATILTEDAEYLIKELEAK